MTDKINCPFQSERIRDYLGCFEDCPDTDACPQSCLLTEEEIRRIVWDTKCHPSTADTFGWQINCAIAKAQLAKAQPIIDAAVRLECQKVIAANNEEYFGRHKAELEQARADERAKVLKELFDAVDELELPIYTTSGSIQESCRRTILRKIRTFDQLVQGKEVKA